MSSHPRQNLAPPRRPQQPGPPSTVGHDIVIPSHLIQAAAAIRSTRDDLGETTDGQTQRRSFITDSPIWRQLSRRVGPRPPPAAFRRTLSAPGTAPGTPAPSRPVSRAGSSRATSRLDFNGFSADDESERKRQNRTSLPAYSRPSSYAPTGSGEFGLTSMPEKKRSRRHAPRAIHSPTTAALSDPFADVSITVSRSSSSTTKTDPFATRNNSISSDRNELHAAKHQHRNSWVDEPEDIYVPPATRARKGTLEAIADAVIPDALQRKLTHVSTNGLTRSSTMRGTFERAKTRGKELQRNKGAQLAFEYGIYLFIVLFIYFVLIGLPLWNGAVWWLYWVVGNKFVLPGGFGITLGIALL